MICGSRGGLNSANYGGDEDELENAKEPSFSSSSVLHEDSTKTSDDFTGNYMLL